MFSYYFEFEQHVWGSNGYMSYSMPWSCVFSENKIITTDRSTTLNWQFRSRDYGDPWLAKNNDYLFLLMMFANFPYQKNCIPEIALKSGYLLLQPHLPTLHSASPLPYALRCPSAGSHFTATHFTPKCATWFLCTCGFLVLTQKSDLSLNFRWWHVGPYHIFYQPSHRTTQLNIIDTVELHYR